MPGQSNPAARRLLTAEQVAERYQIQPSQVYRLTRSGVLPAVKLGRYYRYTLEALTDFERAGGAS